MQEPKNLLIIAAQIRGLVPARDDAMIQCHPIAIAISSSPAATIACRGKSHMEFLGFEDADPKAEGVPGTVRLL
jgi:hypothetical protein